MNYIWDFENKNTYNNKLGHYKFKNEFNYILKNIVGKTVLDLGGGSGRLAIPLSELDFTITVVDLNAEALDMLKSRTDKIILQNANLIEFQTSDMFNSAISIEVLQNFTKEQLNLIFEKVNSFLTDDGLFIFTYVNTKSWRFLFRKIYKKLKKNKFDYTYVEINTFNEIIENNNFEIIDIKGFNWIPMKLKSDNFFVSIFEFLENIFFLKFWINQSPWLLYTIKKI